MLVSYGDGFSVDRELDHARKILYHAGTWCFVVLIITYHTL